MQWPGTESAAEAGEPDPRPALQGLRVPSKCDLHTPVLKRPGRAAVFLILLSNTVYTTVHFPI